MNAVPALGVKRARRKKEINTEHAQKRKQRT